MAFTIEKIKEAHSKVKSGADFPKYIQELIGFGVTKYETYVSDGHTVYFGTDDFKIQTDSNFSTIAIVDSSDKNQFAKDLKNHQQGNTDFPTFRQDSANSGVEKWAVDTIKMTCTYYDKLGNVMLEESIPTV